MAESRILRDLRVLKPVPRGVVVWGEPPVWYPIRSVVDMKNKDLVALFELDRPEGERESMAEQQRRLGKQILLVCPDFPAAELDEMTWQQTVDFHVAALGAGPPPLAQSLARLLADRVPCDGTCEHAECPYLRELWTLKERLVESQPPPDPTGAAASPPTPDLVSSTA